MEKCAIVTGSSSGLGLEITKSLLFAGYTVFGGSRSGTEIEHDNFYDVELDITSEESVEEFYETVREFTDVIHLVVNNAGMCEMSSVAEMDTEAFELHLATNTVGPFLLFKHLESFIVKEETHIISILSTAAHYGYPNVAGYNASKFGQLGLIQSLKKEWKDHKVRFTNLFPGAIDTPLWDKMGTKFGREKMLKTSDFMSVFNYLLHAPPSIQFPEITFLHREGYLE
ncbi:SDR family oxidoreductase [Peredibacter sp. HCB2-198]|uniref:SDR family oxidoreductase n=1 Tax=Peredibacter sp. HCB2-198 TaxID=3383025 RepID=UPI0038B44FA8